VKEQKLIYGEINRTMKLSYLLKQTSDAIRTSRENELRKYNVTPEQVGVLTCIYNLGGEVSPADLTRWLSRRPSTVSILLKRMEKQGLIIKKPDSKKKNVIRLSLTEKGLEAYGYAIEAHAFVNIFKVLSSEEQQQLWDLLKPLLDQALRSIHGYKEKYNFSLFNLKMKPYPEK
jgi:MarR family transcriptional regulator, transcriptional regulator for hemolysin